MAAESMMFAQQDGISWSTSWILMIACGAIMVGSGILLISVANRTADGRLGPNGWAGIRTAATRSSPEAWAAAHKAGHGLSVLGGWAMAASAFLACIAALFFGGDDPNKATTTWAIAIFIGTMISTGLLILGARKGTQAAAAIQNRQVS